MLETEDSRHHFSTTKWTVVLNAQNDLDSTLAGSALESLCQAYWYPLYAFARRKGLSTHDSQDSTQGFFAHLLEKDYLQRVDRSKGKFRSFLMASFTHYLSNMRKHDFAIKRGGGVIPISLDLAAAEGRFDLEATDDASNPERLFDRSWAYTLLDRVLRNLGQDYADSGKSVLFDELKGFLIGGSDEQLTDVAKRLKMNDSAVRMTLHRFRKRYSELFRQEVSQTLARAEDVEEEMRSLLEALS